MQQRSRNDKDDQVTIPKMSKSSKERVRKYRQRLKNDSLLKTKLEENKVKKRMENELYRQKV